MVCFKSVQNYAIWPNFEAIEHHIQELHYLLLELGSYKKHWKFQK